jgi:acetyl esterase/lipase
MKKNLIIGLFVLFCFSVNAQETDTTYKPVIYPQGFTAQLNVVYTTVKDWEGKMDIYMPSKENGPSAIIINIHGGGWKNGVKESQGGFNTFFKAGMAVANMEYRLTGKATAPAAVQDTRCALIYLIQNAKALNIDINRIVIMGGSAGGHLALMGGLLANDSRFDGNCAGIKEVKVAAIIDKYGITDVWDWAYGPEHKSSSPIQWLGDKAKDEAFAQSVSPIHYVNKKSPPTFVVHGDADPTVPYQQSVDLKKKLDDSGVKNEFVTIPGGGHGKFTKEQNAELNIKILRFLTELNIVAP